MKQYIVIMVIKFDHIFYVEIQHFPVYFRFLLLVWLFLRYFTFHKFLAAVFHSKSETNSHPCKVCEYLGKCSLKLGRQQKYTANSVGKWRKSLRRYLFGRLLFQADVGEDLPWRSSSSLLLIYICLLKDRV